MKKSYLKIVALGLTTSVFALASQAMAQGVPADDAEAEGDIIVTATRDRRSLQDVPMSVVALQGDEIQKLSILTARDIEQLAPGLTINGRETSIRGVTFQLNSGTSAAVQLYVNEIPSDPVFTYNSLYDIEQIEVLRGPQGLLRGVSSPGGAITFRTRRPSFTDANGYAQATVTNSHGYNLQAAASAPITDSLAVRVAWVVDGNRANQVYNVSRNEWSRDRTESARVTLGWQPSDNFTTYLTYTYLQSDQRSYPQVFGLGNTPVAGNPVRSGPPAALEDRISVQEGLSGTVLKAHVVHLNAELNLGWGTLSLLGAHQKVRYSDFFEADPFNAVPGYSGEGNSFTPRNEWAGEIRLQSNRDQFFSWGVGAYAQSLRGDVTFAQISDFFAAAPSNPPQFIPVLTNIRVPLKNNLYSINGSVRFDFGDVAIEGGLRYAIVKKVQSSFVQTISALVPLVPPADLVPPHLATSVDHPLTGGINITYEPSPALTVYAAYNRAFRQGSAGVGAPVGISDDLIKTRSETSWAVEGGIKAAFLNRRLNVSVIGFYQKFDGFIDLFGGIRYNCRDISNVCNPAGPPINNATNVPATNGSFNFNYNGNASVKGIEAEISGRPTDNWDISLSLAYNKARYSNALIPCNDFNGDGIPDATGTPRITGTGNISYCASNGRLTSSPDFSLTATTEIRFPINNLTPYVRGLLSYAPSYFFDRSAFQFPSKTNINLYAGLRGPGARWEVFAFAKNLLDQRRITAQSLGDQQRSTSSGIPYLSGYRSVTVTTPREIGLSALIRFR